MKRTYCGELNNKLLNKNVLIKGWIKKNRKLGKLIFLDISDKTGMVQIVLDDTNQYYELVKKISRESIVEIYGCVCLRNDPNLNIKNGDIEIQLSRINILNISSTTPLIIENKTDALEDVRMKYRYLDLRRPNMQQNIIARSKIVNFIRQYMIKNDFVEIETPILTKSTPEGARDYLVPSRIHKGQFYALPQSPQIYKQLLMISGFERYFQVAKCFRDEDLRSDRQPEFTQLDIEMSFVNEKDIQKLIEKMFQKLFKNILNIDIKIPFIKMDYEYAMNTYGSDKPDLRFGYELNDCNDLFINSNFQLFSNAKNNKKCIKYIIVDSIIDKSNIKQLDKYAKDMNAKELMWLHVENKQITNGSFAKHIELDLINKILTKHNLINATLLFVVDSIDIVNNALGIVRSQLANILNLKKENDYKFVWIVNWPLFEYSSEEQRYVAAHHPFTQPQQKYHKTFDKNLKSAKARAYDIVLNGFEVGGGSIRITNPEMQSRMFKIIGLNEEQIKNKFGFLIDAYKYGAPPHGGIALGIDRLVAIMLNYENIKDVIAFPKNASAYDILFQTPTHVDNNLLDDLGINIKN